MDRLIVSEFVTLGGVMEAPRTVCDLATGTDLAFRPLGSVGLRGIPGQWELSEAADSMHDQ